MRTWFWEWWRDTIDDLQDCPECAVSLAFWVALGFAVLLSGCATAPPLVTGPQTVRVEIPVAVPCIAVADIPAVPKVTRIDAKAATRLQVAAGTAADLRAHEAYAKTANALLVACAEAPKP